jgi:hypothetical protein
MRRETTGRTFIHGDPRSGRGERLELGVDVGRGINVAGAAHAFQINGGPAFIAAAQQSGARASRLGYGPLLAIGCGAGLVIVIFVTVITVFLLSL